MTIFKSLLPIYDSKTGTAYGLIRIFLGVALTIRGWLILSNPESIIDLGVNQELYVWVSLVAIAHLMGGVLLGIGFLTRLGAVVQIPILFSATFFVYAHTKLMMGGQSFELAAMVLFLLCIFFIFGAGPISVKEFMEAKKN